MASQYNNRSYVQVGSDGQKRRAHPPPQAQSGNRQTPVGLGEGFGQQSDQQNTACEPDMGPNMGQSYKAYGEALHGAHVQHDQQHAVPSSPSTTLNDVRDILMEILETSRALLYVNHTETGVQGMDTSIKSLFEIFRRNIAWRQRTQSWNKPSPYGDLTGPGTNPKA